MARFGKSSRARLDTCNHKLQKVFNKVVEKWDCSITEGRRGKDRQNQLFKEKRSKLKWPESKHNVKNPDDLSDAVDSIPYPIIWPDQKNRPEDYAKDLGRIYAFVGYVLGIAEGMGIKLRVGADWDGDRDFQDQNFDDLPHFELDE